MEESAGGGERDTSGRLDAFVPELIRRRAANDPASLAAPFAERFPAALLMADLSGFSALAERFSRRGARGAEDLKDLLNLVFGRLVDLVDAHGGNILKFAGDATLALWPASEDGDAAAVRRAARCALAAQAILADAERTAGVRLLLHAGIGFGPLWAANVGGVEGRWEVVGAGPPLAQAAHASVLARPGEVVVSAAAWDLLAPRATGRVLADGAIRLAAVSGIDDFKRAEPTVLPPGAESRLRPYVPRTVQARLAAQQTDWLAEFRRVTVLFVNIEQIDYGNVDALDSLQRATAAVQTSVYRYGGSVNQLLVDDKGTVAICGWGLPLCTHEDDALRAARAALEIQQTLRDAGLNGSFGLASGEVFTGLRGNDRRSEYAMIGTTVNLAARLMQAAARDLLCDASTYDGVKRRMECQALPPIEVKGRDQRIPVFRPLRETSLSPATSTAIVGRLDERRALAERLEALTAEHKGSVVVLESDAGFGKSRLIADVVERAVLRGVRTLTARGDAVERSAPHHVWPALFETLLGLHGEGREERERRVVSLVESNEGLFPFAALLNPVLRLEIAETSRSRSTTPRGRALLTRDLLVHVFARACGSTPTLLVLEDAHWFDSASWTVAEGVHRALQNLMLVIATRPVSDDQAPELRRFGALDETRWLQLGPLTRGDARTLAAQRLNATALDETVAQLILDKAEGHPFYIEELVHALRDRGAVELKDGVCSLTAAGARPGALKLPDTVQGVVTSRIDLLTVPQQLTIKVASVLGQTIHVESLRGIHPIAADAAAVPDHLETMRQRGLVDVASSETTRTYVFKHAITREVAYNLLAYAQRRQLNATAAKWYEGQHADDLAPVYAVLAHHWGEAEASDRAVFYLDKAGQQALDRYTNEEAVRFFREALSIDDRLGDELPAGTPTTLQRGRVVSGRDVRRIQWERRLGEAYVNLGKWDDGWEHLERALELLGRPLPTSDAGWAAGLVAQLLEQLAHQLLPRLSRRLPADAAALLRDAVRAHTRMYSISYIADRKTPLLFNLMAALNLAERLGPSAELATAYADAGNIAGLIPLHRLARTYGRLARRTAGELNDTAVTAKVLGRTCIYALAAGNWTACADLDESMMLAGDIGDPYTWEEGGFVRSRAALLRGDLELAARLAGEVRARSVASGTAAHEIWGISGQAWASLYLGNVEAAIAFANAGLRMLAAAGHRDRVATMDFFGVIALAHLHRGELDQARPAADRVVDELMRSSRPGHGAVFGMRAAAETYVAIWEAEAGARNSAAAARARTACRRLRQYARINPPAEVPGLLWTGCAEWLDRRPRHAMAAWRRCLSAAARFGLPYEEARAHYEMGRRLGVDDPRRSEHLGAAARGFRALKNEVELSRVAAIRPQ
jgi:class 3 adenylate cyclase/tetratricopeptide (TPR) repeat protein